MIVNGNPERAASEAEIGNGRDVALDQSQVQVRIRVQAPSLRASYLYPANRFRRRHNHFLNPVVNPKRDPRRYALVRQPPPPDPRLA